MKIWLKSINLGGAMLFLGYALCRCINKMIYLNINKNILFLIDDTVTSKSFSPISQLLTPNKSREISVECLVIVSLSVKYRESSTEATLRSHKKQRAGK